MSKKSVDVGEVVDPLIDEIEERLSLLSQGDAHLMDMLRRRLLWRLSAVERRAAARRRALNAEKFVAQRGKCAMCGTPLQGKSVGRKGREILPPGMPLMCSRCGWASAATG
jgi:hypothetical protein